jgi:hypothetical protein
MYESPEEIIDEYSSPDDGFEVKDSAKQLKLL